LFGIKGCALIKQEQLRNIKDQPHARMKISLVYGMNEKNKMLKV